MKKIYKMQTFKDFKVRKRGCVMMRLDIPSWDEIFSIIRPEDVYDADGEHGIEHDPHVTVLFGLYSFVHANDILRILRTFSPPKARFGKIGIFVEHPDFDVVMINVESDDLIKMNASLVELPHEETFPDYKPHVTIAYVKKGEAKKYEGMDVNFPKEMTLDEAVYSSPDGIKISIELDER